MFVLQSQPYCPQPLPCSMVLNILRGAGSSLPEALNCSSACLFERPRHVPSEAVTNLHVVTESQHEHAQFPGFLSMPASFGRTSSGLSCLFFRASHTVRSHRSCSMVLNILRGAGSSLPEALNCSSACLFERSRHVRSVAVTNLHVVTESQREHAQFPGFLSMPASFGRTSSGLSCLFFRASHAVNSHCLAPWC